MTTEMTRRYGWAPQAERLLEAIPASHWGTPAVLAALTTAGVLVSMTIELSIDGDVFLAFLEQVPAPRLHPRQLVILDNLAAHKVYVSARSWRAAGRTCCIRHSTPPT